jgi:hypothetical protein
MNEDGYSATTRLAQERPDLIPLLRIIVTLGDEGFNDALDELTKRGLLTTDPLRSIVPPG